MADRPNQRGVPGGLAPWAAEDSLGAELGAVVDDARALVAELGLRPYRVFSVLVRWTGGQRGRGTQELVSRTEVVPPPEVDLRPLRRPARDAGQPERGEVTLRKVSPQYTEEEVQRLFPRTLATGQEAFLEVVADGRFEDGAEPARRRFVVCGAPYLDQMRFEWIVPMRPQDDRMGPGGAPQAPPAPWEPR